MIQCAPQPSRLRPHGNAADEAASGPTDPLEARIAFALDSAGIAYLTDHGGHNPSRLDFALPAYGVEIEVKRLHTPRVAEQMARVPDVIVAQGERATEFLARAIAALGRAADGVQ